MIFQIFNIGPVSETVQKGMNVNNITQDLILVFQYGGILLNTDLANS